MVILLLLWAFAGPLGIDSLRPETASAAEITERALAAVGEAESFRGTLVVVVSSIFGLPGDASAVQQTSETRHAYVETARGDFRLVGSTGDGLNADVCYEQTTGIQRLLVTDDEGRPVEAHETTGLAAGPPDPGPHYRWNLSATVRALRASSDAAVEEVAHEGRPAWTLSSDIQPNLIDDGGPDHLRVTVEQETGFPVSVVYSRLGQTLFEMRLEDLEVDPELPADAFALEFPAGVSVDRIDEGFQRVDITRRGAEAAAVVGYMPVLPSELPGGFVLTELNVAEIGRPSGKEGMNPAAPGVVSALYRRGFDQVVVSTRLVGDDPSLWSDPLASGEGYIDRPEPVMLASGAFAGCVAEVLINVLTTPHLWAMNDTLVLTISGDLTRDELLAVAESMMPVE